MYDLKVQSLVFKGYRKGKEGKVPINSTVYEYDKVKDLDCYGGQCQDGIIDVSFDDVELFDQILNLCEKFNIVTYSLYSPHGGHTYWRYTPKIKDGHDILMQ